MLLMIDNYDSFTYNLVQYFGELGADVRVFRNDEINVEQIAALAPAQIVVSPGPCTPAEAGVYDHANVSHTLAVQVTRHHASVGAALDFILSHPAAVLALGGDVVVESPSGNKWRLNSGKIERHSLAKWSGKTTVHSYTIRGGTFAAVTP